MPRVKIMGDFVADIVPKSADNANAAKLPPLQNSIFRQRPIYNPFNVRYNGLRSSDCNVVW